MSATSLQNDQSHSTDQVRINVLDRDPGLSDLLRSATRSQKAHSSTVQTTREVEEIGLVVYRQQSLLTIFISISAMQNYAKSPPMGVDISSS